MPRKSKFTWNASNTETFQKAVKNFNAKIYYQRKAHPELSDTLPETIRKEELQRMKQMFEDEYSTQQDFDRQMKSIKRFSRRDATKIVKDSDGNKITNWQKKEIQYKVNNVNQRLKKQREELMNDPVLAKKGNLQFDELEEIKPNEMKNKNWKEFEKMLDSKIMTNSLAKREEAYKKKYLEKVESLPADTDDLYNFLSRIPAKVLYNARYQKDKSLSIALWYDPTPADDMVEIADVKWREYLGLEKGETYEDIEAKNFIAELDKVEKGGWTYGLGTARKQVAKEVKKDMKGS